MTTARSLVSSTAPSAATTTSPTNGWTRKPATFSPGVTRPASPVSSPPNGLPSSSTRTLPDPDHGSACLGEKEPPCGQAGANASTSTETHWSTHEPRPGLAVGSSPLVIIAAGTPVPSSSRSQPQLGLEPDLASSLSFATIQSERFQLGGHLDVGTSNSRSSNTTVNHARPPLAPNSPASHPTTPSTIRTSSSPATQASSTSQASTPASTIQPRRPSPGLAARLKALGFGSKKSAEPSPPAPQDRIGRLPEEQIRQIDKNHQASSIISFIERRGRPWTGAAATAAATSSPAQEVVQAAPAPAPALAPALGPTELPSSKTQSRAFLPEIATTPPLDIDMDTQKYRLPDHTNGNGTKVQLETRKEHVERGGVPLASPDDTTVPPPPLPKDTPPTATPPDFTPDLGSYFHPGHQRAGSIYTLSRASFANQLAQLTALQLPDAESLSSKVSAIPTAHTAAKALINAAEQIRSWISKASEVIAGLDSEDDVEWAAAGGREGLAEVESATTRFEELINVYVGAIEELQSRGDISSVPTQDLRLAVSQMEAIINEWDNIRSTLGAVKEQVEIAMEWEELWNMVLGDIQGEMDELCRLVFEMEERRHKSLMANSHAGSGGDGVDIGDLETIVEEIPPAAPPKNTAQNRFSLPAFPMTPSSPTTPTLSQDDSSLLALFARMQPLRASLDFLPMRLSVFDARAKRSFPTACEELEMRRDGLDGTYKKLEKDAEGLRKELGEDRWVLVFRGSGRQAQKLIESVERSLLKLKESVDTGLDSANASTVSKKVDNYEAKKTHYGPAIERVLAIIDKGVKDRLTVNGEILRLNAEMQSKWESLRGQIKDMDATLDEIHADQRGQQLRDSVSSMLSNDRSTTGSGLDTPGSSPPSSVIMSSLGLDPITPTPKTAKARSSSVNSHLPHPTNRRHSSMPTGGPQTARRPLSSRLSTFGSPGLPSTMGGKIPRPGADHPNRPKWNSSTNTSDTGIGHNFKPLSLTTPSPYSRRTPNTMRSASSLTPNSGIKLPAARSPLNRSTSASPMPDEGPIRTSNSHLSFRERINSQGSSSSQHAPHKPRLASSNSMSTLGNRRASLQPPKSQAEAEANHPSRPSSSLASGRRSSLLPQPKSKATGRESPFALAGARTAMRSESSSDTSRHAAAHKPRWRP